MRNSNLISGAGVKKGQFSGIKNPFYGKKHSTETREKMRIAKLGTKGPWSGKKRGSPSAETLEKMSKSHKGKGLGKIVTKETKEKQRDSHLGKKLSKESIKKRTLLQGGEKHWNWKGGITPINRLLRASLEYKLWRKAVFERDGYACVFGGKEHGNKLNADHIKPFALFPELRFAIDNGRTLCEDCHRKTDTFGNKIIYANKR